MPLGGREEVHVLERAERREVGRDPRRLPWGRAVDPQRVDGRVEDGGVWSREQVGQHAVGEGRHAERNAGKLRPDRSCDLTRLCEPRGRVRGRRGSHRVRRVDDDEHSGVCASRHRAVALQCRLREGERDEQRHAQNGDRSPADPATGGRADMQNGARPPHPTAGDHERGERYQREQREETGARGQEGQRAEH